MKVIYNEELYRPLFKKAEELLIETGEASNIVINDLATYYSWLDTLIRVGGPEFLRALPFEEECFEIDSDQRSITPPDILGDKKWVIGVKDDHLAEILWFHVPRFFDGQDLAICFPVEGEGIQRGQTYIQWKNAKGQGLDPVQHVQIDENNIYFGWYLRSNNGVLNCSGDLTFSVRFQYHKVGTGTGPDLTSEVLFSLNTQSYTCKILSNLTESMGAEIASQGIAALDVEDTSLLGAIRPRFSGVFDNTKGAKAYIKEGKDLPACADLIDNEVTLSIEASGSGELSYKWYKDGELIPGAEESSYTIVYDGEHPVVGTYTAQVGNEFEPNKIRWTNSDPCEIPEASELKFAENGNILDCGYADGLTSLSVSVEREKDEYGRDDKGVISYIWYQDALEGEFFDGDSTKTTRIIEDANTNTYIPNVGDVGYYYVSAINTHNGDESKSLVSEKCEMKVPAATPRAVTLEFNEIKKTLTATVDIDHKNDLYYEWRSEDGTVKESPILGKSVYEVKKPGEYYCRVYQHVYPGYPNKETVSAKTNSAFVIITEEDLK